MSTITTGDGCVIFHRIDGPDGAPVLMLSNSLGATTDMWTPQMETLQRYFRVLRYDARGHGQSGAPLGAYGLDRLGRDAIELLDALGVKRVSFCGLSMGGMVGQWLGYRAPERLDRLILCNTSADMGPPAGWDTRIATVLSQGMSAIAEPVLQRWFTPGFREHGYDRCLPLLETLLATSPRGYAGCCAAIRDMDLRAVLPLIRTPTLVIAGDEDPATPLSHSRLLVDAIPGAALCILNAAHLSNVEQAPAFSSALLSFLAKEDASAHGRSQSEAWNFAFKGP